MATEASSDEEVRRLKAELESLKARLSAYKTVHEYLQFTEACNTLAKQAAAACRRKSVLSQPAPAAEQNVDAALADSSKPAAAAAAPSSIASSKYGQLPEADDGVSCLLLRLPSGWGVPRLQAFIERFGAKPKELTKNAGESHALVVFEEPNHRTLFITEYKKAEQDTSNRASAVQFIVKLPGGGRQQQQGTKRHAAAAGAGGDQKQQDGRAAKQQKTDIREVVCPWWDRPYGDQLNDKMTTVNNTLRSLSEKVAHSYGRYEKPDWLAAALRRKGKEALPLPGTVRSPQLNGYRNKAEFTIGLDAHEQPMVGFLLGNYVDGVTAVADPSGCRHMSPTSLAYAAAMNKFLRSSENKLPVWDKRQGKGFWRLLTVREGHSESFLPLPVSATAAGAEAGSSEQQQEVLEQCTLADVPVNKWLVKNPNSNLTDSEDHGTDLSEVTEVEPPAPKPSSVLVMVQIDPNGATGGPEQIRQQLMALAAALRAAAAEQGLPLSSLLVQYHSGVANAAPANAPLTPFPGEATEGADAKQVGSFSDVLCEVKFRVSPMAFFQINAGATCLLYNAVGRMAAVNPNTLLLDVCCGTGTIGLTLAKQVAAVVGVDNVESAIADARVNAEINGITNATFVCGAAEHVLEGVLEEHAPKYSHLVAVVDPPRAGLHRNVLRALLACKALKRLVFVSCNPDSLVLNAGLLCGKYQRDWPVGSRTDRAGGRGGRNKPPPEQLPPMEPYNPFRPAQVLAFDLFPHTKHVEIVMLLERE